MSRDSFDDIDGLLASGLSALAPDVEGGDETLAALRPRFQRARRRARIVKISGVVAVLLVIGSVATLAAPSVRRTHVQVEAPPTSAPRPTRHPTSTSVAPTTTAPKASSTSISLPTGGTVPTGAGSATPATGGTPTTPHTVPATPPETSPHNAGKGSGSGGGGGSGGSTPTTGKPNAHPGVPYSSRGGTIRVRFSGGVLRLISVSPAAGFHPTVEVRRPHLIVVSFRNDHGEWRIRVWVNNGRPVYEVDHSYAVGRSVRSVRDFGPRRQTPNDPAECSSRSRRSPGTLRQDVRPLQGAPSCEEPEESS